MSDVCVTHVPVSVLQPAPRNARRHSAKQIRKLAKIIREFGFLVPILATKDKRVIAGHGRIEAAKQLGMTHVPVIHVEHLTPPQIEALALAENRIGDESSFSPDVLSEIVHDLASAVDFDLSTTAFDTAELDLMLVEPGEQDDDALEPALPTDEAAISRVGDVFEIGGHRIICGDARDDATYSSLMGADRARASIDDLPYNRKINGHVSGSGRHAEFPMASGEMSPVEFTAFIGAVSARLKAYSVDGSLHYLFMDHGHIRELIDGAEPVFGQHLNMCVWVKESGGQGSLYRSRYELIFVRRRSSSSRKASMMIRSTAWRTSSGGLKSALTVGASRW